MITTRPAMLGDEFVFDDGETARISPAAADFSRRGVLKSMGFVAVGFAFASRANLAFAAPLNTVDRDIAQVDAWIAINEDETVTLFSSRIDNGHGTMTGFLQIMAEELGIRFENARAVFGDTALTPDDGGTGASDGIQLHGTHVRQAAATARASLFELAARHFGVPTAELTVTDGAVGILREPDRTITYGKLVGGRQLNLKVDAKVETKRPDQYKIVGQSIPRIDLVKKITGEAEWVGDIRVPGMLHARAVRTTGWATVADEILAIDETSVADVQGLVKVVRIDHPGTQNHFVGVVCEREEQAVEAAEKLKVTWAQPPKLPDDIHGTLIDRAHEQKTLASGGDVEAALGKATKSLQATYKTPSQLKSPIMPAIIVADVKVVDGKVESARLWGSYQRVGLTRRAVGKALGIPDAEVAQRVRVTWVYGAGTFGTGNGNTVTAVDAALLSQAVGKPVRLQWSRVQQHGFDFAWPEQMFNFRAGLDGEKAISAWDCEQVGDDKFIEPAPTGSCFYDGTVYDFAQGTANFRSSAKTGKSLLPSSYIRGAEGYAVFSVESFLDEIAAASGLDPLALRRQHLNFEDSDGYRRKEVLEKCEQTFGWKPRTSPDPANARKRTGKVRGQGMGYSNSDFEHNFVTSMVEVEVDQDTGEVEVLRIVVVADGGLIINPLLARDQVEGSVVMATSRALYEEKKNDGYRVAAMDWTEYPMIRFGSIPKVEAILINRQDVPPGAFGEGAMCPVFPAIGNAIFDATGVRLRQFPFTPDRVLEGLKAR